MVNLACGLKARGYDVEMFVYFPEADFFRSLIIKSAIPVYEIKKGRGFSFKVLWCLIRLFRTGRYDGVISFLATPNIYCELAKLTNLKTLLVVGERSSNAADGSVFGSIVRRLLHIVSNYVVANSESHGIWLRRFPWLRKKTYTIYNGYEFPTLPEHDFGCNTGKYRYLVIGRVHPDKNGLSLIKALILFRTRFGRCPVVSWVGRRESDSVSQFYIAEMEALLAQHPEISANWQWLGERSDVPDLLATHDALIHPSLYEGLPNVVCEAFIAGCPVIASNVCDHPLLVEDGVRGFLFEPMSPDSICTAIVRFEALSQSDRAKMRLNVRKYAVDRLSIDRMVSAYETLLR